VATGAESVFDDESLDLFTFGALRCELAIADRVMPCHARMVRIADAVAVEPSREGKPRGLAKRPRVPGYSVTSELDGMALAASSVSNVLSVRWVDPSWFAESDRFPGTRPRVHPHDEPGSGDGDHQPNEKQIATRMATARRTG
jgi:hypothetical protein